MPIDAVEVQRIAELARLDLDAASVERFRHQLQSILDHIATLDELDVASVPPTASTGPRGSAMREDEPQPSLPVERALANAPHSTAGHFHVPRVLEE